jgi:hypothetical protein
VSPLPGWIAGRAAGISASDELDFEIGEFETELDVKIANNVVGDEFRNENAGFAIRHVALEVREDNQSFFGFTEAHPLDQPEVRDGKPALGVFDPIEYRIDFLDHFRVHGVLPPIIK